RLRLFRAVGRHYRGKLNLHDRLYGTSSRCRSPYVDEKHENGKNSDVVDGYLQSAFYVLTIFIRDDRDYFASEFKRPGDGHSYAGIYVIPGNVGGDSSLGHYGCHYVHLGFDFDAGGNDSFPGYLSAVYR